MDFKPSRILADLGGFVLLAAIGLWGTDYGRHGQFIQPPGAAYLEAVDTIIAPKVSGRITGVLANDNRPVRADQALARTDDRDHVAALAEAKADVGTAADDIRSLDALIVVAAQPGSSGNRNQDVIAELRAAGAAAGLARACGVDPRPITTAAERAFTRLQLDPAARSAALARYRASEAHMTSRTLAVPGAPPCGDLPDVVRGAVRHLDALGGRASAPWLGTPPYSAAGE